MILPRWPRKIGGICFSSKNRKIQLKVTGILSVQFNIFHNFSWRHSVVEYLATTIQAQSSWSLWADLCITKLRWPFHSCGLDEEWPPYAIRYLWKNNIQKWQQENDIFWNNTRWQRMVHMCCFRQFCFLHLVAGRGSRWIYRLLKITNCIQGHIHPFYCRPGAHSCQSTHLKSDKFRSMFQSLCWFESLFLKVPWRIQTEQNRLQG